MNIALGVIHQLFVRLHHALVISALSLVMMVRSQLTSGSGRHYLLLGLSTYHGGMKLYHFIELHEVYM